MPEITFSGDRPRADLIAAVCRRTACLDRSLRLVAEGVLGAGSIIDLVAVDGDGSLVLVLAGDAGQDLELFTRAIAQRAWVTPRVRDWLQLAPALGVVANAPVKLSLLAPFYHPETLVAADAIGREIITLSTYRWVENGSAESVLIEPISPPRGLANPAERPHPMPAAVGEIAVRPPEPKPEVPEGVHRSGARFRTGLTEEDLNLTPLETRDFE